MAITKSKHTNKLSLNVQYDYITLRTPNGNFTVGRYGGRKSSHMDEKTFDNLCEYVNSSKKSLGDTMENLLNPKILSKYFPNWDNEKKSYKVGQTVKFTNPYVVKNFGKEGIIHSILRSNVVVRFTDKKHGSRLLKLNTSVIQ